MFVVYWLEKDEEGAQAQFQDFGADQMGGALKLMEELRRAQHSGERAIAFVTMCSENPNAVGRAGAADPDPDYNWTKRRGNMPRAKRDLAKGDYSDH